MRSLLVLAGLFFLPALAFSQTTYYVPDDFATIQGAIYACTNGDTVVVRPGTYIENIDFLGKAITVMSEKGPALTIIDGGQPSDPDRGSVVYFEYGEGPDSVIDGFTITNGSGTFFGYDSYKGGGILCFNTDPIIRNNIITMNSGVSAGGGIYLKYGSPTISNNIISGNTLEGFGCQGGGVMCYRSDVTITDTIISNNAAMSWGSNGGGLYISGAPNVTITNSTISANSVNMNNGGGGGLYCASTNLTMTNTTVWGNKAGHAGGLYLGGDVLTVTNSTIYGNVATSYAGGMRIHVNSLTITNTISWNNFAQSSANEMRVLNPSVVTVSYSDIKGGQASCDVDPGAVLNWGPAMIDADPCFRQQTQDFHLMLNSPCRNSGDNSAVTHAEDFEGDPRIAEGAVDMGADEFHHHLYHVGSVVPGGSIDIRVVGGPMMPVLLGMGSGIQDPPQSTQYGDLYLQLPLAGHWPLGNIPGNGVLVFPATVPASWIPGEQYPFQALVGPLGNPGSVLSNMIVLTVD